jgi:hypothetical protein
MCWSTFFNNYSILNSKVKFKESLVFRLHPEQKINLIYQTIIIHYIFKLYHINKIYNKYKKSFKNISIIMPTISKNKNKMFLEINA